MDEGGGAAAVEVDRALGAELDHHVGELEHGEAAVDVGAPAVARDRDQMLFRDPERGARVTPVGDVRVELPGRRREALAVVLAVEDDPPAVDEQRSRLHEVAGRATRRGSSRHESDGAVVDDDAGAALSVRRGDGLVARRPAVDPELAERPVGVAQEEAADDGLLDPVPPAPHVQVLGAWEMDDANACRADRVPHRVHRRDLPVRERVPPEQILEAVLTGRWSVAHAQNDQISGTRRTATRPKSASSGRPSFQ
jgi:hypothetical protein